MLKDTLAVSEGIVTIEWLVDCAIERLDWTWTYLLLWALLVQAGGHLLGYMPLWCPRCK